MRPDQGRNVGARPGSSHITRIPSSHPHPQLHDNPNVFLAFVLNLNQFNTLTDTGGMYPMSPDPAESSLPSARKSEISITVTGDCDVKCHTCNTLVTRCVTGRDNGDTYLLL